MSLMKIYYSKQFVFLLNVFIALKRNVYLLPTPGSLLLSVLRKVLPYVNLSRRCMSYFVVSYLFVRFSGSITWFERANFALPSISRNDVASVRRRLLFLLVIGIGCIILL